MLLAVTVALVAGCAKQPYRKDAAEIHTKLDAIKAARSLVLASAKSKPQPGMTALTPPPIAGEDTEPTANTLVMQAERIDAIGTANPKHETLAVGATCVEEAASVLATGKWPAQGRHHSRSVVARCIEYLGHLRYVLVLTDEPLPSGADASATYAGRATLVDLSSSRVAGAFSFGAVVDSAKRSSPRLAARSKLVEGFARAFPGGSIKNL